MGINFSPFDIGRSALRANQLGLTVTGQNIANVNTPGYTRQEVVLSATPGGPNPIGAGVTIDAVRSFRDQFIQTRLQTETGTSGRLTAQSNALAPVDTAFSASGGGVDTALSNFFGSFRDLEANPTSVPLRAAAVGAGASLGAAFASTRGQLVDARTAADGSVRDNVNKANSLASQIAGLNVNIRQALNTGQSVSELQDQRDQATQSLAQLTGVRTTQNQDGTTTLTLGDGSPLVLSDQAFSLQATSTPPNGLAAISLNGQPAAINNGAIRGQLDAIGQISSQIDGLDALAASVANRVNTLHTAGADLQGAPGTLFFAQNAPVTAANLTVSAAIQADPTLVVAGARCARHATGDPGADDGAARFNLGCFAR